MQVPTPNATTTTTDDQCTSIDEERRGIPKIAAPTKGQNPIRTVTVWIAAHERDERRRRGGYRFSFSAKETLIVTEMRIG